MIVSQLWKRYRKELIYTYVGDILVSINPFQPLDIYNEKVRLTRLLVCNLYSSRLGPPLRSFRGHTLTHYMVTPSTPPHHTHSSYQHPPLLLTTYKLYEASSHHTHITWSPSTPPHTHTHSTPVSIAMPSMAISLHISLLLHPPPTSQWYTRDETSAV